MTRRFRRHRQMGLVATGQHHSLQGTGQELAQRQDHHLLLRRMHGREDGRFKRLVDPGAEIGQRHAAGCIGKFGLTAFVQTQGVKHGLPGHVARQTIPLPDHLQGAA